MEYKRIKKLGIYDITADHLPNLFHEFANRVQERPARIFHEMQTISNLRGIRQSSCDRFTVTPAPVSGDNQYGRTLGKPGPRRFQCPLRQQRDQLPALQIANNRSYV